MPYTPTSWVNGTTALNQTHLNNLETQYTEASLSLGPDMFTAGFVLSGYACTKDGVTANKLDVAAGTAYLVQADGTTRRRVYAGGSQTTSTPSTTYYLFLNNDGTFTWGTSSSGPANSIPLCQATTDGSGNILVVTDKRALAVTLLPAMVGVLTLPMPLAATGTQVLAPGTGGATAGTYVASPTLGVAGSLSGDNDPAVTFNGTSQYATIPMPVQLDGMVAFTLETVVKPTNSTNGSNADTFSIGDGGVTGQSVALFQPSGGGWAIGPWGASISGGASVAGTVYHVVGTFDGTNYRLYVNGALVAGPTAMTTNLTGTHAGIGAQWSGSAWSGFFPGTMKDAAIYNYALTATQVSNHHNAIASGTYRATVLADDPMRLYRLDETSGTAATDAASGPALVVQSPISAPRVSGQPSGLVFETYDGVNIQTPLALGGQYGGASSWITNSGAVGGIAGQATAGSFGVPVIVASVSRTHVSSTAAVTLVSFTPPGTGLYRVSAYIRSANTSSSLTLQITCNDPDAGSVSAFPTIDGTATQVHTYAPGFAIIIRTVPIMISANNGGTFTVTFTDSAGTPNDNVSVIVERLI